MTKDFETWKQGYYQKKLGTRGGNWKFKGRKTLEDIRGDYRNFVKLASVTSDKRYDGGTEDPNRLTTEFVCNMIKRK